jgi:hypothetical protein
MTSKYAIPGKTFIGGTGSKNGLLKNGLLSEGAVIPSRISITRKQKCYKCKHAYSIDIVYTN